MKKSIVFMIHAAFWVFYFSLLLMVVIAASEGFRSGPSIRRIISLGIPFVVLPSISVFYGAYFYVFPKYLQTAKIGQSFAYGLLFSVCSALMAVLLLMVLFDANIMFVDGFSSFFTEILFMTIIGFINGIIGFILKGFITWYDEIKVKEALIFKNHQVELELVKSQLDPHFLFNTINNIDVLILKDAQLASEYLNKLSDILRFMLFETKTEKIALSKEIEYIEKYISLQKTRTLNNHFVDFSITGNTANEMIAPMLFIPFVENAFKHVSNKKTDNAIKIKLVIKEKKITFECENKYTNTQKSPLESTGLGNELIRKRIELLYPKKHNLVITNQENNYKVNLVLTND